MCLLCGSCLFSECLCSYIPYLLLLSLPLYGAVVGLQYALRFSLLMYVYALLAAFMPRIFSPILGVATLGVFAGVPMWLVPEAIVWCYEQVLWLSHPFLLTLETVQAVLLVRTLSQYLVDLIEDNPTLAKAMILCLAIASYAIGFCTLPELLQAKELEPIQWALLFLGCLQVIVLLVTLGKSSGVISDAGMTFLLSFLTMKVILYELRLRSLSSPTMPANLR